MTIKLSNVILGHTDGSSLFLSPEKFNFQLSISKGYQKDKNCSNSMQSICHNNLKDDLLFHTESKIKNSLAIQLPNIKMVTDFLNVNIIPEQLEHRTCIILLTLFIVLVKG